MNLLRSSSGDTLGSTLILVVVIVLAAGLMFVFPLMVTSSQNDKIAYNQAYVALVDFTNNSATIRKISEDSLDTFQQKLNSTGNLYEVQVEIQRLDQNPSKKVTQVETTKIGENLYYTEFYTFYTSESLTDQQIKEMFNIKLNSGDILTTRISKTNLTIFEIIQNAVLQMTGSSKAEQSYQVVVK